MVEESRSLTNRRDQIEALLQAKSEVEEKLNSIFSDERERLTEVLQNMMRIDHALTAQMVAGPMREVIAPLTTEAKTELLEQIWAVVQEDLESPLSEQVEAWGSHDRGEEDREHEGAA